MSEAVRIVSYNVLCSHLASPDYYVSCERDYLSEGYRFTKLTEKLEAEIKLEAIICLQEVSTLWASRLHTFFICQGYYFVTALYGHRNNGFMSVCYFLSYNLVNALFID